jgi:hypothetical protein
LEQAETQHTAWQSGPRCTEFRGRCQVELGLIAIRVGNTRAPIPEGCAGSGSGSPWGGRGRPWITRSSSAGTPTLEFELRRLEHYATRAQARAGVAPLIDYNRDRHIAPHYEAQTRHTGVLLAPAHGFLIQQQHHHPLTVFRSGQWIRPARWTSSRGRPTAVSVSVGSDPSNLSGASRCPSGASRTAVAGRA